MRSLVRFQLAPREAPDLGRGAERPSPRPARFVGPAWSAGRVGGAPTPPPFGGRLWSGGRAPPRGPRDLLVRPGRPDESAGPQPRLRFGRPTLVGAPSAPPRGPRDLLVGGAQPRLRDLLTRDLDSL